MGKDFVIHAVKVYKEFPYINKKEDKQLSRKSARDFKRQFTREVIQMVK